MDIVSEIKTALAFCSVQEKKEFYPKFFKSGKGEYAEGDEFIGVTVPDQRKISKAFYSQISLPELGILLSSKIHEHRQTSLFMLVSKYEKSKTANEKKEIVEFYLQHKKFINNWDLVDVSCYKILGAYCFENQKDSILLELSKSKNLWEKRMAVVSTMFYVKKGEFQLLKRIVTRNLLDSHDLMHKANGWLLREMGKKNESELLNFLDLHYQNMPRTTLRYSIEKLEENLRQSYLQGKR